MSTSPTLAAPQKTTKRTLHRGTPASLGLPDPRPVTGFSVAWVFKPGVLKLTITLDQPCVVRQPKWVLVDYRTGASYSAVNVTVNSNVSFDLDYPDTTPDQANFVEVPFQDTEVQNFQGGFVRPGARWFRF